MGRAEVEPCRSRTHPARVVLLAASQTCHCNVAGQSVHYPEYACRIFSTVQYQQLGRSSLLSFPTRTQSKSSSGYFLCIDPFDPPRFFCSNFFGMRCDWDPVGLIDNTWITSLGSNEFFKFSKPRPSSIASAIFIRPSSTESTTPATNNISPPRTRVNSVVSSGPSPRNTSIVSLISSA